MKNKLEYFKNFMFATEGGSWFMKPVCDFFGLDYDNQVEKIKNDKICQTDTGKFPSEQHFGDKRLRLTLQNRGFTRWVQMTNASNIRVELQEKFEIFQANIFEYLWNGNVHKNSQLEDLRVYIENVNEALKVRKLIKEYIDEQNAHRDLCLATSPERWTKIRKGIIQYKSLPIEAEKFKALEPALPNTNGDLRWQKNLLQRANSKDKNRLLYQTATPQKQKNPMPEGYKREKILMRTAERKQKIIEIDQKIEELKKSPGSKV